jgi:formiminotetrahydrofolate cyclodeaminase
MTRRTLNADGTITLKSFSYWGNGDAAEAFRQELAELEKRNRQAQAVWDSLTPEEREQRTRDFEARQQALQEAMRAAAEIPPKVLAKIASFKG